MIQIDHVQVAFGDFVAIPDLNLKIREGEFFTMLGPSGCGKTTALRAIAGFVTPAKGDIYIDDIKATHLESDKRQVGMVFQNYALFPSMNVWENIAFGLKVKKMPRAEVRQRVADIARRVDLTEVQLAKNVDELSGGQQQRVAIARALVLEPKILLLDEPLSNLDAKLRHQLRAELKQLQNDMGITTVYVTHDQDEALSLSDRIAVFRQGVVEHVGTPREIYDQSATEFVCNFIGGSSQLNDVFVKQVKGKTPPVDTVHYLRIEKVSFAPHPESGATTPVSGTVTSHVYHGLHSMYGVKVCGALIKVLQKEHGSRGPRVGEDVTLYLNPDHILSYAVIGEALAPKPEVAA